MSDPPSSDFVQIYTNFPQAHRDFVDHFCEHGDSGKAAIHAGFSSATAGILVLQNEDIQRFVYLFRKNSLAEQAVGLQIAFRKALEVVKDTDHKFWPHSLKFFASFGLHQLVESEALDSGDEDVVESTIIRMPSNGRGIDEEKD